MSTLVAMGGRMAAGRVVTAPDPPAGLTHPQMHTAHAAWQTLLAARNRRRRLQDLDRGGCRLSSVQRSGSVENGCGSSRGKYPFLTSEMAVSAGRFGGTI